jgi:hypothetical protein
MPVAIDRAVRAFVEIEKDGVVAARASVRDDACHVGHHHLHPLVGQGESGKRTQGTAVPIHNLLVEINHGDRRPGRKLVQGRTQAVAHAKAAQQDARSALLAQRRAGNIRQNILGAMMLAVHQDTAGDGHQEIALAAASQFEDAFPCA